MAEQVADIPANRPSPPDEGAPTAKHSAGPEVDAGVQPAAPTGDALPAGEERGKAAPGWRRWVRGTLHALFALAVVAAGVAVMTAIAATKPTPQTQPQRVQGPLVAVEPVQLVDVPVEVAGFGAVQPHRLVAIVPQVGGRVVDVHPALTAGGVITAGQTIIQIDPRDYELAVRSAEADIEQAAAAVEQAQTALALEQAEAAVRRAEWRDENGPDAEVPDLVARRPQVRERRAMLASAKAQLASAEAAKARAELDLRRTTLTSPFDARVMDESVDVGQTAVAGQSLATLFDRRVMRIVVPLDDEAMRWIELPEARPDLTADEAYERGVPVRVTARYAGRQRSWRGRALHTTGQVDTRSRLVDVVVEVRLPSDPDARAGAAPLLPGMFVTARFEGPTIKAAARIPRHAVREDGRVWVAQRLRAQLKPIPWSTPASTDMDLHARLTLRPIVVARSDRDHAIVTDGLEEGELVITSSLDVVTDGMGVRLPTPPTRPGAAGDGALEAIGPEPTPTPAADAEPDDDKLGDTRRGDERRGDEASAVDEPANAQRDETEDRPNPRSDGEPRR